MAKSSIQSNAETIMNKNTGFMSWVQEFSKKIVTITFIVFLIVNVFVLVMIALHYFASGGDIIYLDQLLSETHITFRDVIGGYIIKAATENVIKITGTVVDRFLENRLKVKEMDQPIPADYPPDEGYYDNSLALDDPNYIPEGGGKG